MANNKAATLVSEAHGKLNQAFNWACLEGRDGNCNPEYLRLLGEVACQVLQDLQDLGLVIPDININQQIETLIEQAQ